MTKLYKGILIFVFALVCSKYGYSQSATMYYMGTTPQSYYLNPATQPECNFYIGLPIFSPSQINYYNSGFSPSDLLWYDSEIDSNLTPLYSAEAADKFLANLDDVEYFRLDMSVNLASFGFRAGDLYFSFDASIKGDEYISYPKDLLNLILKGNVEGQTFDFSSLSVNMLNYAEFGVNVSKNWGDFSVGIRPKVLFGLATINTQASDISLQTSTEEWVLESNFNANVAVTGMEIPVDEDGLIDLDGDFNMDIDESNWQDIFSKNRGLGIDLGVHYRPLDELELSLSILDLGYIKWGENPHTVSQDGSYTFQGMEWNPADTSDWDETILDTISSNLELKGSSEAFTTRLNPKIIVGGRYFLSPGFDVGVLYKTEFLNEKINQNIILLADWHPFKGFSLSGSYTLLGKTYSSFGLGMGFKVGPFNMYLVSDYIPMYHDNIPAEDLSLDVPFENIPLPVDLYNFNFRLGMNLVFGCNKVKRQSQDKPLLNSTNWMF